MLMPIRRKQDWCQNTSKANNNSKNKEGGFTFVKGQFHQQDITILRVCASNDKS